MLVCGAAQGRHYKPAQVRIRHSFVRPNNALSSHLHSMWKGGGNSKNLWVTFTSVHNMRTRYPQFLALPV